MTNFIFRPLHSTHSYSSREHQSIPYYCSIFAKMSASLNKKSTPANLPDKTKISHQLPYAFKRNKGSYFFSRFDRIPAPARNQHSITRLHRSRHDLALLIWRARAAGDHGALMEGVRRRRSREENSRRRFLLNYSEMKAGVGRALLKTHGFGFETLDEGRSRRSTGDRGAAVFATSVVTVKHVIIQSRPWW